MIVWPWPRVVVWRWGVGFRAFGRYWVMATGE